MSAVRAGGVTIGGLLLATPVLPASGTFGLAHARVFDIDRLGALVPKTVTPEPRAGNPAPRLVEAAGGLVNAIGIPGDGIEAFIAHDLPRYLAHAPPTIASISAGTPEAFAEMADALAAAGADAVELNLSCPNLEAGGHVFAIDAAASAAVVAACRRSVAIPLWAKLSPAAADPADIADACESAGADAVVAGNTMPALTLAADGTARLGNRTGGLSGPPLLPVSLRIVDQVARRVSVGVVGCGGVSGPEDARQMLSAGAAAVAVGSATFARPATLLRLIEALAAGDGRAGV